MERPDSGYGFYKVAACTFPVVLGDVFKNAESISRIIKELPEDVHLAVFPELCLTGYTCGDLFLRSDLYEQAEFALRDIKTATQGSRVLVCIGMPVEDHGKLFNCAVYLQSGNIKGIVPKTYIPNYGEYQEKRWFVSSSCRTSDEIRILGCTVPFSENLLLKGSDGVVIGTEICEDLWVDSPPSGYLSRAGATVIVNPSASNDIVGKSEYRRNLVKMQSGRCRSGYVYASCGEGESSTDLVFSGHCMVADNGHMVAEGKDRIVIGCIDIERCINDRRKYNSDVWEDVPETVETSIFVSGYPVVKPDYVCRTPFAPVDETDAYVRSLEIVSLQARGLAQRLKSINTHKVVFGLSGGLDSTLALIACSEARALLARQGFKLEIHCLSMPTSNTSDRTSHIVERLAMKYKVNLITINIDKAYKLQLSLLEHPEDTYDVTYENAQARQRTMLLFNYANQEGCIVVGTGDMSELALGWCTYCGDQMSNYAINAGVPKTLVRKIVEVYSKHCVFEKNEGNVLRDVLALPVSPELLPLDKDGGIAQSTETELGSYELHDFYLYNFVRNGFSYKKIKMLAGVAFPDISGDEIERTLDIFYSRFRTQQFKRSTMPDSVKVGSVALSPRSDWRMPSDMARLY